MIIYNTKTIEDYNSLMIELESKGYKWLSGDKPTHFRYWSEDKERTCIKISGEDITSASLDFYKENYPNKSIIEYKSKGESMTKTNVDKELCLLTDELSENVQRYAETGNVKNLSDAVSRCTELSHALIEEELNFIYSDFKIGDYVVCEDRSATFITQIEILGHDNRLKGLWYDKETNAFKSDYKYSGERCVRKASEKEIEEYKVALQFHEHDRKPFELKEGDLVKESKGVRSIVKNPNIYVKELFYPPVNYELLATVEEIDECIKGENE